MSLNEVVSKVQNVDIDRGEGFLQEEELATQALLQLNQMRASKSVDVDTLVKLEESIRGKTISPLTKATLLADIALMKKS